MAVDHIRYDILTQDAMRGVVRTVLSEAAKNGLPGDHHFYIAFDTRAEGVRLSERMRAQYPAEMTIVLQHQFWDLIVSDEAFEVGLSFGGVAERLLVPFVAIKGFADPSVQFGLQFEELESAEGEDAPEAAAQNAAPPESQSEPGKAPSRPPAEHKPVRTTPAVPAKAVPSSPSGEAVEADKAPDDGPDKPPGGGEVVRLDRFRKK